MNKEELTEIEERARNAMTADEYAHVALVDVPKLIEALSAGTEPADQEPCQE